MTSAYIIADRSNEKYSYHTRGIYSLLYAIWKIIKSILFGIIFIIKSYLGALFAGFIAGHLLYKYFEYGMWKSSGMVEWLLGLLFDSSFIEENEFGLTYTVIFLIYSCVTSYAIVL